MEIINCSDPRWNLYLSKLPPNKQDIYYTSEYHKAYEANGDGTPLLFVFESQRDLGIYPFMLNKVPDYGFDKEYYDIQSVYGYSGPLLSSNDKEFHKEFENAFLDYSHTARIIAEFIRFHPLQSNTDVFTNGIEVLYDRQTVYLNLQDDLDIILANQLTSNGRRDIRLAQRKGLATTVSNYPYNFINIYKDTMTQLKADNYYQFNDSYFTHIASMKSSFIIDVHLSNKVIASAIFFVYGDYCHYHLSGSDKDYSSYCPNNLLLWEAIKLAKEKKCKTLHFGGGRTSSPDDSLLRFKSNFSKNRAMYYIGKRILNDGLYEKLIEQWETKNNKKATILLAYRK